MSEINTDFIQTKYGYCYFEIESGKNPIIWNLYIHPQYRKQGHAKEILRYVIEKIRDTGYAGDIDIEPDPRDGSISYDDLCKFYEDMGLHLITRDFDLSAARAEGYREALKDVLAKFNGIAPNMVTDVGSFREIISHVRRAYEKGSDGNGKTE